MRKKEIIEELEKFEIEHDPKATVAELRELLDLETEIVEEGEEEVETSESGVYVPREGQDESAVSSVDV